MDESSCPYSIDRDDAIISVSDSWLGFARENDAYDLTRESVLGRPIWDFVAGTETQKLYAALFARLRAGEGPFLLPFRCDSPDRFRFMRLALAASSGGAIELTGILIREQERPFFSILDRAFPRTETRLPMCSLCKKIQAFGLRWLELEDAVRELDLLSAAALPRIDYVVCDGCSSPGSDALGGCAAA